MLKVEETELVGVGGGGRGWGQSAWSVRSGRPTWRSSNPNFSPSPSPNPSQACAMLKVAKTELAPMARQLAV